jgi:anti-sigma factor RsiW
MSSKLMKNNRLVGALWCTDVLARLPGYLEGELPPATRSEVELHLAGCDNCRRFGGEFAGMVSAVGRQASGEPLPPDAAVRLRARLADEFG